MSETTTVVTPETAAPAAKKPRVKRETPSITNSVRKEAVKREEVGMFGFSNTTEYAQLPAVIKAYMDAAKKQGLNPTHVHGSLYLTKVS